MTLTEIRDWLEPIALLVAILGGLGAFFTVRRDRRRLIVDESLRARQERQEQLRQGEVVDWGRRAIIVTRRLRYGLDPTTGGQANAVQVADLADLSALIDEGRLYFRNAPHVHGSEKPPAFQGIRPRILDPLVACHDALLLARAEGADGALLRAYAKAEQDFVSLLQEEVGRVSVASPAAGAAGSGSPLRRYYD